MHGKRTQPFKFFLNYRSSANDDYVICMLQKNEISFQVDDTVDLDYDKTSLF